MSTFADYSEEGTYPVSFSPDDEILASVGFDDTVRLLSLPGEDLWGEDLIHESCDWLDDYLITHPEVLAS